MAEVACLRPELDKTSQRFRMERKGAYRFPLIVEGLVVAEGFSGRTAIFFQNLTTGRLTMF